MKNNWGRRLFIAGAVMLVLISAVHSISLFQKPMIRNESEKRLVELMTNYRFTIMGSVHTMNDFFRGFSISFGLAILGFAALDLSTGEFRATEFQGADAARRIHNAFWLPPQKAPNRGSD